MHTLFRYISFQEGWDIASGESMAFCLNWNAHTDATLTQYHLIDGCDLTGTHNGIDISNSDNGDHRPLGQFSDVIVQFNKVHVGQVGNQMIAFFAANVTTIAIRYNDFWGLHKYMGTFGTTDEISVYYNRCHNSGWYFYDHDEVYFSYNLMRIAGYSDSFRGHCMKFDDSAAYTAAQSWGANCVGNLYYAPEANSSTGTPIYGSAGWVSFATWQGFGNDVGGQNTDPGFYSPADGQFVEGPTAAVNWPNGFTSLESSIDDGGSWQSYTDNTALSFAAYLTTYDTILFRAVTDTSTSNQTISGASDADSLDTASESYSATLTYGAADNPATFGGDTSGTCDENADYVTGILSASDAVDGMTTPNFTVTVAATHGEASINSTSGAWSYTPDTDYFGSDSFTVRVTDDLGNHDTQVITITVNEAGATPTYYAFSAGGETYIFQTGGA